MQTQNRWLDEIAGLALKALGQLDTLGLSVQKIKELCDMPERIKSLEQEIQRLSEQLNGSDQNAQD